MSDLVEGVIVQAKECDSNCLCNEQEKEGYYQALLMQSTEKRSRLIREMVSVGVPRHQARLRAKQTVEAEAKAKAEDLARAKSSGTCYLFFDPTDHGKVALGYEDIDVPVLTGERFLRAVYSLGEFTAAEMREIMEKGVLSVPFPGMQGSMRKFKLHNTTPLRKVYNLIVGAVTEK